MLDRNRWIESKVEQQQNEEFPKENGILKIDFYLSVHYVHLHKSCQKLQNWTFKVNFPRQKL